MIKSTEIPNAEQFSEVQGQKGTPAPESAEGKKTFVEPEVSYPIDVLEATTFFQGTDSGATP